MKKMLSVLAAAGIATTVFAGVSSAEPVHTKNGAVLVLHSDDYGYIGVEQHGDDIAVVASCNGSDYAEGEGAPIQLSEGSLPADDPAPAVDGCTAPA